MTDEEVAVHLAEHKKEIGSLKYRVKDLEELSSNIQSLAVSVEKLATNMANMCREQEKQGQRISVLEEKPAKRWDVAVTTIITALASGIIGYMLSNIL